MDIFTPGTIINIIIYDNIMHKDINVFGPYLIHSSYKQNTSEDVNYTDDSYLIIKGDELANLLMRYSTQIIKGKYTAYIINVSKYLINPDNVENFYEDNTSLLQISNNGNKLFNTGDVVKLIYSKQPSYTFDADEDTKNEKIGIITNEVCYRILDTYLDNGMSCIILNGIVDTFLMEQEDITTYISYPYEKPVHYAVKVVGDATEYSVNVGYKGYRT
jgi:hypothetical protein